MSKYFLDKYFRNNFILLAVSLFLVRLVSIYTLPWGGSFFTTHSISRYLILIVFINVLYILYSQDKKIGVNRKLTILILFYFISQSLSVIKAENTIEFLFIYKNIIFGILVFFISYKLINSKNIKTILLIFLITSFINIIYEFLIYFAPDLIYTYFQPLFADKYWNFLTYQISRGRFFHDIFDEMLIPFILYYFFIKKSYIFKSFLIIYLVIILFLSILSNWRYKIIIFVFSISASIIFYFKKTRKNVIPLAITGFILVIQLSKFVSSNIQRSNTIDRLLYSQEEDVKSIYSRFYYWKRSIDITLSSPLFGVGLGNYFDHLSSVEQISNKNTPSISNRNFIIINDPHNIFFSSLVSSGILGLMFYILLIYYFIKNDFNSLRKKNNLLSTFIIVFWSFFSYSLFNPAMEYSYQFIFWFLRGAISKLASS